jgi:hypothetical protein
VGGAGRPRADASARPGGRHHADEGPPRHAEPPEAREVLLELCYPILDMGTPLAEYPYAVGFGSLPLDFGGYDDLLMELRS